MQKKYPQLYSKSKYLLLVFLVLLSANLAIDKSYNLLLCLKLTKTWKCNFIVLF